MAESGIVESRFQWLLRGELWLDLGVRAVVGTIGAAVIASMSAVVSFVVVAEGSRWKDLGGVANDAGGDGCARVQWGCVWG